MNSLCLDKKKTALILPYTTYPVPSTTTLNPLMKSLANLTTTISSLITTKTLERLL